jgi:3-dehydroquinate synthase
MPVSEDKKSLETVQQIWDFLFAHGITRRGLLICIGGGVLTDIGGFAAATYKRGVDYLNVPTTLLAMIDASSGGKTGINYGGLKNSIGCFAPPVETLICPDWLKSLPANQWLSGFGEMLKTGLVSESSLWYHLLRYDLEKMDSEALKPLIAQCVAAKKRIVEADPKEEGLRKVLNFGHTFGHALEEISIQKSDVSSPPLLHGYAVVYGMIAELYLSVVKLRCPKEPLQQLTQVMLHYYGKPQCKCSDREALVALMQQDKKNERTAQINCTLIQNIGSPLINQVITSEEANEALEYLFSL